MSLNLETISAGYGNIQAIWDVSLKVEKGEIVALIGANGAGKTTILKTIVGLVKLRSGSISFENKPLKSERTYERVKQGIGYVAEGRRLFPAMTVLENLRLGAPRKCANLETRFGDVFSLFPILKERKNQVAGTLSGGEQQMVAIGRALMSAPKMLLLDELSFGLSPIVFERVLSAIEEANRRGVTILLAEQNSERALEVSSRAYILENGRITAEGPSKDMIEDPKVKLAYLGVVPQ